MVLSYFKWFYLIHNYFLIKSKMKAQCWIKCLKILVKDRKGISFFWAIFFWAISKENICFASEVIIYGVTILDWWNSRKWTHWSRKCLNEMETWQKGSIFFFWWNKKVLSFESLKHNFWIYYRTIRGSLVNTGRWLKRELRSRNAQFTAWNYCRWNVCWVAVLINKSVAQQILWGHN